MVTDAALPAPPPGWMTGNGNFLGQKTGSHWPLTVVSVGSASTEDLLCSGLDRKPGRSDLVCTAGHSGGSLTLRGEPLTGGGAGKLLGGRRKRGPSAGRRL